MTDKGDYHGNIPSGPHANMSVMSTIHDGDQAGEGPALVLVPGSQPWYATAVPSPALDRRELEDEHTRVLAQAVGDHLPYELALRAAELAAQLQRTP
jgi:hypothetical protein